MYLFVLQLFDTEHYLNTHSERFLFTTEGHVFPILREWREKPWLSDLGDADVSSREGERDAVVSVDDKMNTSSNVSVVLLTAGGRRFSHAFYFLSLKEPQPVCQCL